MIRLKLNQQMNEQIITSYQKDVERINKMINEKTGLVADAYFSASKIAWILEHVDGARALAESGDLLFGS